MRISILAMAAMVIIAGVAWFLRMPSVLSRPHAESPIGAKIADQRQQQPDKAVHSAAAAIRLVQVGTTPMATAQASQSANPPAKHAASTKALASSSPPPKTAAELLAPFLEDDPKQVFLPDTVRNHAAVEAESVDPDWGPAASKAINDYLNAQLGDRADLVEADCRTDLCELQIVSSPGADVHDFQQIALSMLHQQDWWTTYQFDQNTGVVTFAPDGRIVIIWFYSRI